MKQNLELFLSLKDGATIHIKGEAEVNFADDWIKSDADMLLTKDAYVSILKCQS